MPKKLPTCFFISPIGEKGSTVRKRSDIVLKSIVKPAARLCGYHALRADDISEPGIVTRQAILHVMQDPLVIADLSYGNPNVHYELAYRHFSRKPAVIIIQEKERVAFDVNQIRAIPFDYQNKQSRIECREKVIMQIRSIQDNPANFGIMLDYFLPGDDRGSETEVSQKTPERRKLREGELKPYTDSLKDPDPQVRESALKQISGLAFTATIEDDLGLLQLLAEAMRDPHTSVVCAALNTYERLGYQLLPTKRRHYNKKLIPIARLAALKGLTPTVRRCALEAVIASKDSRSVKILGQLHVELSDEDYNEIVRSHLWQKIVRNGQGPNIKEELFKRFRSTEDESIRARITRILEGQDLG